MTLNRLHRGKLGKKLVLFNAFVGRIKLTYEQYFLFALTYEKYFLYVLHMATFPYLFVQPKSALRITMINLFFVICLFLTHSRYWWTPLPPYFHNFVGVSVVSALFFLSFWLYSFLTLKLRFSIFVNHFSKVNSSLPFTCTI